MRLTRRQRPKALISLTPLVDVVLILLVFFMVTSSYLDLDAFPLVDRTDRPTADGAVTGDAGETEGGARSSMVILRLGADEMARGPGFAVPLARMEEVRPILAEYPRIAILPSGGASLQGLVTALDALTAMGMADVQIVRIGGQP